MSPTRAKDQSGCRRAACAHGGGVEPGGDRAVVADDRPGERSRAGWRCAAGSEPKRSRVGGVGEAQGVGTKRPHPLEERPRRDDDEVALARAAALRRARCRARACRSPCDRRGSRRRAASRSGPGAAAPGAPRTGTGRRGPRPRGAGRASDPMAASAWDSVSPRSDSPYTLKSCSPGRATSKMRSASGSDLRLAVEPEESRLQVEDPVPVPGEPRQELLRPLEAESPVDDGQAEDVEAGGARLRSRILPRKKGRRAAKARRQPNGFGGFSRRTPGRRGAGCAETGSPESGCTWPGSRARCAEEPCRR